MLIQNYKKTLDRCHSTVGIAILNTSITIVFGFSILILSNFIPTIYFGIFTGIAMLLAMISVLTLLPQLILIFRPFGQETLTQNNNEFPSVQLSVKNPISSKVLVFLMLLQVFSNIGIFMLLLNVLE